MGKYWIGTLRKTMLRGFLFAIIKDTTKTFKQNILCLFDDHSPWSKYKGWISQFIDKKTWRSNKSISDFCHGQLYIFNEQKEYNFHRHLHFRQFIGLSADSKADRAGRFQFKASRAYQQTTNRQKQNRQCRVHNHTRKWG